MGLFDQPQGMQSPQEEQMEGPMEGGPIDPDMAMEGQEPPPDAGMQQANPDGVRKLVALAENVLYDKQGLDLMRQFVSEHLKDVATGAGLFVVTLLLQMRQRIQDFSDSDLMGPEGAVAQILDSVYEILHELRVKTTPEDFKKSYDLIQNTYDQVASSQQMAQPQEEMQEGPSEGLFGGMPPDQMPPEQQPPQVM